MATGLNGILRGVQPDLRGTIMELAKEGWTPSKTSGGHIRLDHPKAVKPVFTASTPSDFRTTDNLRRDCRGALRPPLACQSEPISEEEAMSALRAHKKKRKTIKQRPSFIEAAGQRVVDGIAKTAHSPRPKPVEPVAGVTQAPKLPAPELQTIPATSTTETSDMKMTTDITATEGPVTPKREPAPRKAAGRPKPAAAQKTGVETPAALDAQAFELGLQIGMRVASGELMQIRISEDMVGKTLILEKGEIFWVSATTVSPQRKPAKNKQGRRNGKLSDAILDLLKELKGEEVPVSLIADHMIEKGHYKPRSARPGVQRRLEQLAQDGLATYYKGPGEPFASHVG